MENENNVAIRSPIMDPVLINSPFFAGLSELEFNAVTTFMERRRIPKGETVFKEGDPGEELYILLAGELDAYIRQSDGAQRSLFNVTHGDFFGEMSVIAKEPRSATITAKEDTDIMVLHGIDFYRIIFEHPNIGVKILKTIGKVQNGWLSSSTRHMNDLVRWGETARRRAITDELTGLYNRRFLDESIRVRFSQGAVGLRKICLMVMDLDRIHGVNDMYGSQAGDQVIIAVADIIRSMLRSGDISARLAGDEFAVLLPDTNRQDAMVTANRIREAVHLREIIVPEKPGAATTTAIRTGISIGVAEAPTHANSEESLFYVADMALHQAKELGRNRVAMAQ